MKKKYKEKAAKVRALFDEASGLAEGLVEEMARDILREHTNLDHFAMENGYVFFVTKGGVGVGLYDRAYCNALGDFLDEWADAFGLTGNPMMFTADGEKKTEWK